MKFEFELAWTVIVWVIIYSAYKIVGFEFAALLSLYLIWAKL